MSKILKFSEVNLNNGINGAPVWIVVKGSVYDVTNFLAKHPGGKDAIMEYAGKDATKAFSEVGHSPDAIREMKLYKIGLIDDGEITTAASDSAITTQPKKHLETNGTTANTAQETNDRSAKFFCCC